MVDSQFDAFATPLLSFELFFSVPKVSYMDCLYSDVSVRRAIFPKQVIIAAGGPLLSHFLSGSLKHSCHTACQSSVSLLV